MLKRWLPWTFACTAHESLLHDTCPGCGEGVRVRLPGHTLRFPAGTCTLGSRLVSVCGTDLTSAKLLALDSDHPLLTAQRRVDNLLADPSTAHTVLADLNQCTSWLMHTIDDNDIQAMGPVIREQWHRRPLATRTPADRAKPLAAAVSGVVAHAALPFLDTSDETFAARTLHVLRARHDTPNKVIPRGMTAEQWSQLSPATQRRFLHAGNQIMGALDRVRFSSSTPRARLPEPGDHSASARIRHVPQLFWPGWTVRLMPREGMQENLFRGIAAALLLLPGEPVLRARGVTDRLGPHLPNAMTVTLQRALKSGHPDVLTALCSLAHHLDDHGSPIDYERRRRLVPAAPISPDQWRELCYRTGTQPGEQLNNKTTQAPRYLNAQRYLNQLLTGADLTDPRHPLALRSAPDRSRYSAFPSSLTLDQRDALHQHAIGILHDLNIDEPLTWEPPQQCAAGLDLPGRRLDDIDLEEVRRIVITEQQAPREAARQLNTTHPYPVRTRTGPPRTPRVGQVIERRLLAPPSTGQGRPHHALPATRVRRRRQNPDPHRPGNRNPPPHRRRPSPRPRLHRPPHPQALPHRRDMAARAIPHPQAVDPRHRRRTRHRRRDSPPTPQAPEHSPPAPRSAQPHHHDRQDRHQPPPRCPVRRRRHPPRLAPPPPLPDRHALPVPRQRRPPPEDRTQRAGHTVQATGTRRRHTPLRQGSLRPPSKPTTQGRRLLRHLETDRVQALMTATLPHDHTPAPPDDHVLEAAHAKFQTRRNPGPPTSTTSPSNASASPGQRSPSCTTCSPGHDRSSTAPRSSHAPDSIQEPSIPSSRGSNERAGSPADSKTTSPDEQSHPRPRTRQTPHLLHPHVGGPARRPPRSPTPHDGGRRVTRLTGRLQTTAALDAQHSSIEVPVHREGTFRLSTRNCRSSSS